MKQQSIFSGEVWLSIRAPHCLKANGLSSLLAGGVFVIAGLNLSVASAATLTEAAALLNIQSSGEVTGLVRDAEKLLRNFDKKGVVQSRNGTSIKQRSSSVDENVIPFLNGLVKNIATKKFAPQKAAYKQVSSEKVVVKSEAIVIRPPKKVQKLPVVKHWAGLNRTHPSLSYARANALLKKAAVAKPPAVLQILPKVIEIKKAEVQYSIKQ